MCLRRRTYCYGGADIVFRTSRRKDGVVPEDVKDEKDLVLHVCGLDAQDDEAQAFPPPGLSPTPPIYGGKLGED